MVGIRRLLGTDYWQYSGKRRVVYRFAIVQHVHGVSERSTDMLIELIYSGFCSSPRPMSSTSKVSPRVIASS